MKIKLVLSAIILMAGILSIFIFNSYNSDENNRHSDQNFNSQRFIDSKNHLQSNETLRNEILSSKNKYQDIEVKMNEMEKQVSRVAKEQDSIRALLVKIDKQLTQIDAESSDNDDAHDDNLVAETAAITRMQSLEYTLEAEEFDEVWEQEVKDKLKNTLAHEEIKGLNLVSTNCGSTLCKAELMLEDGIVREESMQKLSLHRSWKGATTFSIDSLGFVTLYLAKEGHELPN